jgi:hypothetical protein
MDANPMVWMVEVDGFIRDARSLPLQIQEIAYAKGLIPYIPALKPSSSPEEPGPKTSPKEPEATAPAPGNGQLGLF